MTTAQAPNLTPVPRTHWSSRALAKLTARSKAWAALYLLMMPTILSMVIFSYYPKYEVVIKAFYEWEPGTIDEFTGVKNFVDAFSDPLFWQSFQLVAILLVANLFKMWPGIITAIALHRMASDRWRYIYQVLFVIPMVIPGLVWLLIWKSFYEPDFGIFNRLLNLTGVMPLLHWLDGTAKAPGFMPQLAEGIRPVFTGFVDPVFGGVFGMMLLGAVILTINGWTDRSPQRWAANATVLGLGLLPIVIGVLVNFLHGAGAVVGLVLLAAMLIVLIRSLGAAWIIWPFWILAGLWAFWGQIPRLPLTFGVAIAICEIVQRSSTRLTAQDMLRNIGLALLGVGAALVVLGMVWVRPTGQFEFGSPAWLGNKDLVIPAVIFWGFPWVGTVGVLIYLAGLQQISQDVYEAAEIDGVGPIGRMFRIELPLIMTQVRINLIFMTIGTLTSYEFFLILLGPNGGPGNRGMVPGLYMYQQAFLNGRFGYACALGMVLFIMILLLTVIYQKYVKVEK